MTAKHEPRFAAMGYRSIVPSDGAEFCPGATSIFVAETGDVAILGVGDVEPVVMRSLPAGGWHDLPGPVARILRTGTTAAGIIAYCGNPR